MSSSDEDGYLERLLDSFLKRQLTSDQLGESLADDVAEDAALHEGDAAANERSRASALRGMFDGSVARARASMTGGLGTFGTALRRVREEARFTPAQMAQRAGISPAMWADLEEQAVQPTSLDVETLTSVLEAAQLQISELRATLRAQNVRLLPGGRASYRTERLGSAAQAAHEDLLAAVSAESGLGGGLDEDAIEALLERVAEVFRRRRRDDLL